MTRQAVRDMKRMIGRVRHARNEEELPIAREAATKLLERSVSYGHGRLAVIRLSIAAQVSAEISPPCWAYCHAIVEGSGDLQLKALFLRARRASLSWAATPGLPTTLREMRNECN